MTIAERNQLVEANLEMVAKIAGAMMRQLPPSVVLDDMYQEGVIGLMRAAERYDPSRRVAFPVYAKRRVVGAIKDANRRRHYRNATLLPLSDAKEQSVMPDHDERIDAERMARQVNKVVSILKPRQRGIVERYYGAEQSSKQIAREAGMLTPRVGEIRRAAVIEMRSGLERRGIKKAA